MQTYHIFNLLLLIIAANASTKIEASSAPRLSSGASLSRSTSSLSFPVLFLENPFFSFKILQHHLYHWTYPLVATPFYLSRTPAFRLSWPLRQQAQPCQHVPRLRQPLLCPYKFTLVQAPGVLYLRVSLRTQTSNSSSSLIPQMVQEHRTLIQTPITFPQHLPSEHTKMPFQSATFTPVMQLDPSTMSWRISQLAHTGRIMHKRTFTYPESSSTKLCTHTTQRLWHTWRISRPLHEVCSVWETTPLFSTLER